MLVGQYYSSLSSLFQLTARTSTAMKMYRTSVDVSIFVSRYSCMVSGPFVVANCWEANASTDKTFPSLLYMLFAGDAGYPAHRHYCFLLLWHPDTIEILIVQYRDWRMWWPILYCGWRTAYLALRRWLCDGVALLCKSIRTLSSSENAIAKGDTGSCWTHWFESAFRSGWIIDRHSI